MISVEMWEICVDQMPWSFIFFFYLLRQMKESGVPCKRRCCDAKAWLNWTANSSEEFSKHWWG